MALLEINKEPTSRELKWFGALFGPFFLLFGGIAYWKGFIEFAYVLWALAVIVPVIFFAIRATRKSIYMGWMYLVYPIGWMISHLVLAITYFFVLMPIGLIIRLTGRDPMTRRFEPDVQSYWVEHRPDKEPSRYFRQF